MLHAIPKRPNNEWQEVDEKNAPRRGPFLIHTTHEKLKGGSGVYLLSTCRPSAHNRPVRVRVFLLTPKELVKTSGKTGGKTAQALQ
jgi:hypothetical protein